MLGSVVGIAVASGSELMKLQPWQPIAVVDVAVVGDAIELGFARFEMG